MNQADLPAVDEANFAAEVAAKSSLVVLDFWAAGCAPCKQLGRLLAELAPSLPPSVHIATVNVEDNPGLVHRFNVNAVPTLVFLKNGVVVETRTGIDRRQVIKKIVETHA